MKNNFDLEVKKILKEAEKEMFDLNHPYVGSEHMLLAILKLSSTMKKLLYNFDLTYERFRDELIKVVGTSRKKSELALYTPLLKRIICDAKDEAIENNGGTVTCEHLILGMLEEGEGIGIRILINMGINLDGIYSEIVKSSSLSKKNKSSIIQEIGKILTGIEGERIFKRDTEIQNLVEILLRKNKNNPLLLGEAGVGKTAIVEELAKRIVDGNVPDALKNFIIVEMDTGSLISGTRYRGEFEDRLNKIIKEACEEKNVILFIDEIHTLVNCGGAEGAVDAANILKPYLARGDLKIIGATTFKEYKSTIFKDKALDRRFQIINVEEPSLEDTKYILKNVKHYYEEHHNVLITDDNIEMIVDYSDKYIYNRFNPDKSLDILDSVCAHVQMNKPSYIAEMNELESKKTKLIQKKEYKEALLIEMKIKELTNSTNKTVIRDEDIKKIVEYRANIPILDNFNADILRLSDIMKSHILGQDKQIDEICEALKMKYFVDNKKPLSILLMGSKGVGKTTMALEIANNLFGTKQFLRLDMSEMSGEGAINKLIGSPKGYVGYDEDCLLSKIIDHPYSIILLDEIEKSSMKVQNLFLEILENGKIRNSKGEIIHFENTTIVMTTGIEKSMGIGFNNSIDFDKVPINKSLYETINKIIILSNISEDIARKFIKRESSSLLSKQEINEIIEKSKFYENGLRGVQKELNKYKISKLLTKV